MEQFVPRYKNLSHVCGEKSWLSNEDLSAVRVTKLNANVLQPDFRADLKEKPVGWEQS
jgi:hypothetical protein